MNNDSCASPSGPPLQSVCSTATLHSMDIQGSAFSEHQGRLDTDDDSDSQSTTLPRIRKHDKIFALKLFRSKPKAKPSQVPTPEKATAHRLPTVRTQGSAEIEHAVISTAVSSPASNVHPMTIPTGSRVNIFSQNQHAPAVCVSLPIFGARIETTLQLALCIGLLPKDSDTVNKKDEPPKDTFTNDAALLAWVKAAEQDPTEQERIRSLGARMVDEFAKDTSKDSTEIAEMVVLGPVLDNETYRRLLQSTIAAFDQSVLLKVDLLQGLVQLVQSAPAGSLVSDDLVKILSVLRIRLQGTHQQSLEHFFHLTLAVSRLLDVMAEHEVKDVDRVIEHEPLYGVLSGLKGSSDPYHMYQACYAFQALQYVPDNETPLQAVFRHSMGVVDGLVKASTILKLDLGTVLEGLANLQQAFESAVETAGNVYEDVSSLIESGQGVLVSLKEGYGNGQRQPWYTAIRAANAFVQAGQLKDLNSLIYETPCRRDPLFQWGICQLLGEMVSDALWDTTIRQKAVHLLGDLCQNDPEWGQDNSVKMWIHSIIGQLSTVDDEVVSTIAQNLLKDLHLDQVTTSEIPYPLRNRLPLPTKSPTLIRVLTIPDVESDLHRLKLQRLEAHRKGVYIPPLAKPGLKANDDDLFPLMEKVLDFLASKRQVMLVLGDSGSGKSTFNRHLENRLWIDYKRGGAIPLFINLPSIRAPEDDMIGKQLKSHSFSDEQILELKLHRQLIVICDGYDESQQQANLHYTNLLNRPGQWSTKMVISCRTQFLGPNYVDRFKPQSEDRYASGPQDLFQEAIIAPFSKEQIRNYVEQYAHDLQTALLFHNPSLWSADEYMDKLTAIPNVMDLVKNPFLLTLALKALPGLAASNKDLTRVRITRAGLYDKFIDQWLETNRLRLQNNTLSNNEQEAFNALEDDDFIGCGIDYLRRLAAAIFEKQDGNPVVQYIHRQDKNSWKAAFFGTEPEVKLLRDASPLMRTGNQYRFVHRSVLEYFLSRVIFNPTRTDDEYDPQVEMASPATLVLDAANPLFQRNLLEEPSIIQFLCDRVNLHPNFKQQLLSCIDQSKTDASATVAATNAISILVRAGVPLHGADLRGVKIPRADLSGGQFDFAQLQGADLRGVNLAGSWLRQADISGAQMEGVRFGELPYIQFICSVIACNYSPDGKMLAICLVYGLIEIYDTTNWSRLHQLQICPVSFCGCSFSPNSRQIVSESSDHTVRLWDSDSGAALVVMNGHTGKVTSVAFSPCGRQIASAGHDTTVRLWDSQTGEELLVLRGHTTSITSVKYSPDGRQLVSGSWDATIRFWDPTTGEPGVIWRAPLGVVSSLAYSPDGRWIVFGQNVGGLQLWNTMTGESRLTLSGHTKPIEDIAVSPDGRWIASSSHDHTVKLWDASTGAVVTTLTTPMRIVGGVAFSPDSFHLAFGGTDMKVRLWEVNTSLSTIDSEGQQTSEVQKVTYSSDGQTILSLSKCVVQQWDRTTGSCNLPSLKFKDRLSIRNNDFPSDGTQITTKNRSKETRQFYLENQRWKYAWEEVDIVSYSPCCRWVVSSTWENICSLHDLRDTKQRYILLEPREGRRDIDDTIGGMTFSRTGDQLAVGTWDGVVRLFNPQTRDLLTTKKLTEERILAATYSPNSRQLALGTDTSIYLWDLQSDEPSLKLDGHGNVVCCVAYAPCSQWIASGSKDWTVRLWQRQSGEEDVWLCVCVVRGYFGYVEDVVWNPYVPMELATACEDGSIRVWRLSSDDNDGNVVAKLIWGTNLRLLCAEGLIFKDVIDVSPIHQKLLVQCGALGEVLAQEKESNVE